MLVLKFLLTVGGFHEPSRMEGPSPWASTAAASARGALPKMNGRARSPARPTTWRLSWS